MKFFILVGSARPGSYCRATATALSSMLEERGAETEVWNPCEWPLPLADPAYHRDPSAHPDANVRALVGAAESADGFALISPVYHNSYSALLKNCVDHLAIPQFRYKPVLLASHSGGLAAVQVCDHLRIVVRGLSGLALPHQVVTVPDDFLPDADGSPILANPPTSDRLENAMVDLLFYARVGQARIAGGA